MFIILVFDFKNQFSFLKVHCLRGPFIYQMTAKDWQKMAIIDIKLRYN